MTSALIILALSPRLSFLRLPLSATNDGMTENPIHGRAKSVIRSGKQGFMEKKSRPFPNRQETLKNIQIILSENKNVQT